MKTGRLGTGTLAIVLMVLGGTTLFAQAAAIRGTWSGHWVPELRARDAVSVRFSVDGDHVTGELINPRSVTFGRVSFEPETGRLVAEVESAEFGQFRIEATLEEETRLNGTFTHDDVTGEMRLTKWTYVPRIR